MPSAIDCTTIDIPFVLRDRLARGRQHPRQAYHEVIEAALDFWDAHGGWDLADGVPREADGRHW